jgi:hypothetical protein
MATKSIMMKTACLAAAVLCAATAIQAANRDLTIRSYHWQPTKDYALGGTYNAKIWNEVRPVANVPAITAAGSNSPLPLQIVDVTSAGDFLVESTQALWLDTAANGKRYVSNFHKPLNILLGPTDAESDDHTVFYIARGAQTAFSAKIVKWGSRFRFFIQHTEFETDTMTFHFEKDSAANVQVEKKIPLAATLKPIIESGRWIPYYVRTESISGSRPTMLVRFGVGTMELFMDTCVGKSASGADIANDFAAFEVVDGANSTRHPDAQVSDIHVFCTSDDINTAAVLWSKFFADSVINGPVEHIPMVIHNIIYDPPGKQSYSTCQFDTSLATSFDYSTGMSASASVEVGSKSSVTMGDFSTSWTATVKGEVHYANTSDMSSEVSFSSSTLHSSMTNGDDSILIGPAFGDVVVHQKFAYRVQFIKRPRISRFRTAYNPQDYVWATGQCAPLPDSCSTIFYTPIRTLVSSLQNDSVNLSLLQREYPFDLKTGRLRPAVLLPSVNDKGATVPPRVVASREGTLSVGGAQIHESSISRDSVAAQDNTKAWGASVTVDVGLWSPIVGEEVTLSGGCDFSETAVSSSSRGSTVAYHLEDDNPWNIFKITPMIDNRFKTVLFVLDTGGSYSSFPFEANTRHAVSWQIGAIAACTCFVGQPVDVAIKVKNTAVAYQNPFPESFPFSVSAINFPGEFSVSPSDLWIKNGEEQTFTVTFTATKADSFVQQIKLFCINPEPNNGSVMTDLASFPMVVHNASVGLVARVDKDTAFLATGSQPFNNFHVWLKNVGDQAADIQFGSDSASAGTTVNFSSIANPVDAKDSALLTVSLTGNGSRDVYYASFWTQMAGQSVTRSHHMIVIKMQDPTGAAVLTNRRIRDLSMWGRGGRLEMFVPASEKPVFKLFSIDGRVVVDKILEPGRTLLDFSAMHLPHGYYIVRLAGSKILQQKVLVTGKK